MPLRRQGAGGRNPSFSSSLPSLSSVHFFSSFLSSEFFFYSSCLCAFVATIIFVPFGFFLAVTTHFHLRESADYFLLFLTTHHSQLVYLISHSDFLIRHSSCRVGLWPTRQLFSTLTMPTEQRELKGSNLFFGSIKGGRHFRSSLWF